MGLSGKESACNAGDLGSIPGMGWSPVVGNGKPRQYSSLGNPPGTEDPGGLNSMGSQRIRYDSATEHTHTHTRVSRYSQIRNWREEVGGCDFQWVMQSDVSHLHSLIQTDVFSRQQFYVLVAMYWSSPHLKQFSSSGKMFIVLIQPDIQYDTANMII